MVKEPQVINASDRPDGFGHQFVRFVRGKNDGPGRWVESCVFNRTTGEKHLCWPVDARELVASGEYQYDPVDAPDGAKAVPPPEAIENPDHVVEATPVPPKSRRAARKKSAKVAN